MGYRSIHVPKLFETVRRQCGEEVELLHDIHERLDPIDAINVVKSVEPYHPFFIEDPFSPEQMEWFKQLRNATTVPLAMGELFNNINEFKEPMTNRLFDYIRIHISQIGGISPAMKVARLGEFYGIKTAWHGPGDVSPVGHAANAHIDLAIWNFGIQEAARISDLSREIFPGSPTMKDGYMWVNEVPGLGVDINEKLAAKYPMHTNSRWTVRKFDGTIMIIFQSNSGSKGSKPLEDYDIRSEKCPIHGYHWNLNGCITSGHMQAETRTFSDRKKTTAIFSRNT